MTSPGQTTNKETTVAFWVLFVSQCCLGAALAPFLTIAITYVDDNTDPQTSALCVGIAYSVGTLGMVLGFLVGAGTTSAYVDLSATSLSSGDPDWVGAWWLGSVCIATAVLLFTLPFLAFPRDLQDPVDDVARKVRRQSSIYDVPESGTKAEKLRPILQRKVSILEVQSVKDLPSSSRGLFTNVVFVFTTLGMCGVTYLPSGLFTFMPKYFETQFGISTMAANISTAVVMAAMASGTFVGGWISASYNMKPLDSSKFIFIMSLCGAVCLVISMFLGCPGLNIAGSVTSAGLLNTSLPCNSHCACGPQFNPVCANDVTYYSICHAGCSSLLQDQNVTDCSCLVGSGSVTIGSCLANCATVYPYAVIMFLCVFFVCLGQSPMLALLIRCVDKDEKSIALAINNVLTSVLSSIPGPIIFGRLIDTTCLLLEESCSEASSSACVVVKNEDFRYILHGLTLGCVAFAVICFGVSTLRLWRDNRSEFVIEMDNPED